MKKMIFGLMSSMVLITGCGTTSVDEGFNPAARIAVLSRESGSGTRGAFVEILNIEENNPDGTRRDLTTVEATIAPRTDVMMVNVSNDINAIGYISLGSLNDTVRALYIDGVAPTAENVRNGSYMISRPFNIVFDEYLTYVAYDFLNFILSSDGQAIVAENYIEAHTDTQPHTTNGAGGTVTVSGSTSVAPVMNLLREAYEGINPNATIEIQSTGSSSGITSVIDGVSDIGMVSRDLRESESEALQSDVLGLDGIVIIVNNNNGFYDLSSDQVRNIFIGEYVGWSDLG